MSLSKKGQVQTIAPAILGLIFASIVLVFGLIMIQETRDTDVIANTVTTTITNETVTAVTQVEQDLAGVSNRGGHDFSGVVIYNATTETIHADNYTVTAAGVITAVAGSVYNNTDWTVTYTYIHGDEAYASADDTITGMGTFADFWEIIVLAIVISVVIGLLLITFGGRQNR